MKGADYCKQALSKAGRCFVCLKRGHVVRECYSKAHCSKCGGRHHRFICIRVHYIGANSQGQEFTSPTSSGSDPVQTTGLNQLPTSTFFVEVENAVLLQTAKCASVILSSQSKQ